ncbi:MAG: sigma-54 dependent transcriptional regulator, partial [candidate division KSB1 bacterium]|nr:sigma-54 dependent transcriptional regulator [candidate division KSB1 bacterium]
MAGKLQKGRILIVDDEEKIRTILAAILHDEGYEVETAKDGLEAIEKSTAFKPQLLIVDLKMPRMDGLETIMRIKDRLPRAVAIILTAHGTIPSAVQAIKQGVYDYLTKPFDNEQMLLVVQRALEVHRLTEEIDQLKQELGKKYGLETIIGESPVMQAVRQQIRQIAGTDATVLIEGESGTGKELVARAIHYESQRKNHPLVIVDCTAIPANLIESEFFGHEKGAFTDARQRRIGKFEEADTGTIFLDEIGELPLEAQAKLLRVLQEKEFTRVGGNVPIKVDLRVIAATNKNLEQLLNEGKFREDLFYRLNVLKLRLPPLREHVEDMALYVRHFLAKYRETFGKNITSISTEALDLLKAYDWKGNIRELENVVQRAMLHMKGTCIEPSDLEFLEAKDTSTIPSYDPAEGLEAYVKSLVEQAERRIIFEALK